MPIDILYNVFGYYVLSMKFPVCPFKAWKCYRLTFDGFHLLLYKAHLTHNKHFSKQ